MDEGWDPDPDPDAEGPILKEHDLRERLTQRPTPRPLKKKPSRVKTRNCCASEVWDAGSHKQGLVDNRDTALEVTSVNTLQSTRLPTGTAVATWPGALRKTDQPIPSKQSLQFRRWVGEIGKENSTLMLLNNDDGKSRSDARSSDACSNSDVHQHARITLASARQELMHHSFHSIAPHEERASHIRVAAIVRTEEIRCKARSPTSDSTSRLRSQILQLRFIIPKDRQSEVVTENNTVLPSLRHNPIPSNFQTVYRPPISSHPYEGKSKGRAVDSMKYSSHNSGLTGATLFDTSTMSPASTLTVPDDKTSHTGSSADSEPFASGAASKNLGVHPACHGRAVRPRTPPNGETFIKPSIEQESSARLHTASIARRVSGQATLICSKDIGREISMRAVRKRAEENPKRNSPGCGEAAGDAEDTTVVDGCQGGVSKHAEESDLITTAVFPSNTKEASTDRMCHDTPTAILPQERITERDVTRTLRRRTTECTTNHVEVPSSSDQTSDGHLPTGSRSQSNSKGTPDAPSELATRERIACPSNPNTRSLSPESLYRSPWNGRRIRFAFAVSQLKAIDLSQTHPHHLPPRENPRKASP